MSNDSKIPISHHINIFKLSLKISTIFNILRDCMTLRSTFDTCSSLVKKLITMQLLLDVCRLSEYQKIANFLRRGSDRVTCTDCSRQSSDSNGLDLKINKVIKFKQGH